MEKKQRKRNHFAEKIVEIAKQKNIPLDDDPELRKILFKLELGCDVPPELYNVITEILSFVCRVSKKAYSENIN